MPVRVTLSQRGNITNVLEKRFAQMNGIAPEVLGKQAIESIQAPDSPWPVLTGLSKENFFYRVTSRGSVSILNRTNYARHVEAFTGAAARAIDAGLDRAKAARELVLRSGRR